MMTILNKPIDEVGALKALKVATWSFAIFAIIKFLNDFSSGQQNYLLYAVQFSLIFLLLEFKKQIFSIMLALFYLIPFLLSFFYVVKSNTYGQVNFIIFYFFLFFLCYRSYQATRIINGEFKINSGYIKFAWVLYLLFVSIAYIFSLLTTFLDSLPILLDYIDIPFSIVGLLGLFGYIFKIKIFNSTVWKIALFAIISWHCFSYIYYPRPEIQNDVNIYMTIGSVVVIVALLLPAYTALYLYGYKSFTIWNKIQQ
jgi:hypothetical protein